MPYITTIEYKNGVLSSDCNGRLETLDQSVRELNRVMDDLKLIEDNQELL